jgi:hypothetical protein
MTALRHVRTASLTWGLFIACTCAYCLTYQAVVWAVTPDVAHTVSIAMREWGAWLITTPLVFGALSRGSGKPGELGRSLAIGALAVCAAVSIPVVADLLTATRSFAASLAIFFPRNVLAFAGVWLVWQVFVRREAPVPRGRALEEASRVETMPGGQSPSAPALCAPVLPAPVLPAPMLPAPVLPAPPPSAPTRPDALLVSKGADQCLVAVNRIQRASAAGNYVEIHADGQAYLTRSTLSQVEERLPGESFVRIHRSHVVRIEEIGRIRIQRSGSGTVTLRNGCTLPISKRYRAALQALRVSAN